MAGPDARAFRAVVVTVAVLAAAAIASHCLRPGVTVTAIAGRVAGYEAKIAATCRAHLDRHEGTWGCGPTCWAVAHDLNRELFGGSLPVGSAFRREDHIRLVVGAFHRPDGERLRLEGHVWLEVRVGGRVILVDPTHGQYGPPDLLVREFEAEDRLGYFAYMTGHGYSDSLAMEGDPYVRCRMSLVKSGIEAGRVPVQWREWELKLDLGRKR